MHRKRIHCFVVYSLWRVFDYLVWIYFFRYS